MFDVTKLKWTREPGGYDIKDNKIEIITKPYTDLWQRTYYHFRNDNAPVLQMKTSEKYFSFIVKTKFDSKHRFDQCGVVIYLDSDHWLKASAEYGTHIHASIERGNLFACQFHPEKSSKTGLKILSNFAKIQGGNG